MRNPEPSGKNRGAYHGEPLSVAAVLRDLMAGAAGAGWEVETFGKIGGMPLTGLVWNRDAGVRAYLSAGIHGDEPAGPLAAKRLIQERAWPADLGVFMCPCLNPTGFVQRRRENQWGQDLNRDYCHFETLEVRAHCAWLRRQPPFDVAICLHEDWEAKGFYLYELNPDGVRSWAQAVMTAVAERCPIDVSAEIDGRAADGGIIRPSGGLESRERWPEAFYLVQHKTRLSYTLEAPSDYELEVRVEALTAAAGVILRGLRVE